MSRELARHRAGSVTYSWTLVERTIRFTLLIPLTAKDATAVRRAFTREVRPAQLRRSLTYDQGQEMREHRAKHKVSGTII